MLLERLLPISYKTYAWGPETGFFPEDALQPAHSPKNTVSLTKRISPDRTQFDRHLYKSQKSSLPFSIAKSAIGVASFDGKPLLDAKNPAIAAIRTGNFSFISS